MNISREEVLDVLGKIIEPDLKNDLVSLNLIEQLSIDEAGIAISVKISNPALQESACKKPSNLI
jgi:ATP-binding protein involved in chromosome partitioning